MYWQGKAYVLCFPFRLTASQRQKLKAEIASTKLHAKLIYLAKALDASQHPVSKGHQHTPWWHSNLEVTVMCLSIDHFLEFEYTR